MNKYEGMSKEQLEEIIEAMDSDEFEDLMEVYNEGEKERSEIARQKRLETALQFEYLGESYTVTPKLLPQRDVIGLVGGIKTYSVKDVVGLINNEPISEFDDIIVQLAQARVVLFLGNMQPLV